MRDRMRLALLLLLLPASAAAQVASEAHHPVEAIRQAALGAVPEAGTAGTSVEPLVDPRLRLPLCSLPLSAVPARPGTVEIACSAPAWRLYVPVRVRRSVPVLVARRVIAPNTAIGPDDVGVELRQVAGLTAPGLGDPASAVGRLARRMLTPGTVVTARDLAEPPVLRRGDAVTLIARGERIEVRVEGRALGTAAIGERVSVQNLGSRRIVQARALGPGQAEVVAR